VNHDIQDVKSPETIRIISDLVDTMHDAQLVGIAAPQIGENVRIFVTEPRQTIYRSSDQTDVLRIYINPHILSASEETIDIYEGCGSVGNIDIFGKVTRPATVTVEAMNETGKRFQVTCNGLLARIIQHEMDHLEQKEFLDRMSSEQSLLNREEYQQYKQEQNNFVDIYAITLFEYGEL
jgi:peptide deformylase